MLKHSLAIATLFATAAVQAQEADTVPHYSINAAGQTGSLYVMPEGQVITLIGDKAPLVTSCNDNTNSLPDAGQKIHHILDKIENIKATAPAEAVRGLLQDINVTAGGMRFTFEECQKTAQPDSPETVLKVRETLNALETRLSSMLKATP